MLGKKCKIFFIFISQKSFFREKKYVVHVGQKYLMFFYISQHHFF